MRQCCCWKAVSGSALAPVLQCSVLGMSPAAGEPQNHRCHLLMAAELSSGESPKKSHRAFVSSQPASPPARALRAVLANRSPPPTFCPTLVWHLLALGDPNTSVA